MIEPRRQAQAAATLREEAEGPAVADRVITGDRVWKPQYEFVIVASRRKEGWRLRLGEPWEAKVEGRLQTFYPLNLVRDIQVDRRIQHYDWPANAPPLPDIDDEG